MKLKSAKPFLMGFTVGAVLFASTSSFAASTLEKIQNAYINKNIKVAVDGKTVSLTNKPITYNNINYLPVAEVAKALDAKTAWDGSKQTINITSGTDASTAPTKSTTTTTGNGVKILDYSSSELGDYAYSLGNYIASLKSSEYISSTNEMNVILDKAAYEGYKKITDKTTKLVLVMNVAATSYREHNLTQVRPSLYETLETNFIYNGKIVLTFRDEGVKNDDKDLTFL